jgi:hypothetical protein
MVKKNYFFFFEFIVINNIFSLVKRQLNIEEIHVDLIARYTYTFVFDGHTDVFSWGNFVELFNSISPCLPSSLLKLFDGIIALLRVSLPHEDQDKQPILFVMLDEVSKAGYEYYNQEIPYVLTARRYLCNTMRNNRKIRVLMTSLDTWTMIKSDTLNFSSSGWETKWIAAPKVDEQTVNFLLELFWKEYSKISSPPQKRLRQASGTEQHLALHAEDEKREIDADNELPPPTSLGVIFNDIGQIFATLYLC